MIRKCIICGDEFETEVRTQKVCGKQHYRPCPICGKLLPFNRPSDRVKFCSKECSRENTRRKNLEKYGVEHPMQNAEVRQHHRDSMIEKYGVESPLQSEEIKHRAMQSNQERFGTDWALGNNEVRKKAKETMKSKYGAEYTMQSDVLMEKVKSTSMERYGVENPQMDDEIKKRTAATYLKRYGVENPMQSKAIQQKAQATRLKNNGAYMTDDMKQKAQEKWLQHYVLSEYYKSNLGQIRISNLNIGFGNKLEMLHIPYSLEFSIGLKVYDIAIMEKNILIEIDPTYTHNAVGNHWNPHGLDPHYHLQKTLLARDNGYRCIHVFDWDNQFDILGLVADRSPIYARKCELRKIETKVVEEFTNSYHLQGSCRGQKLAYGLFYNSELIQIMSFGKPRYNPKYQWELLRLCTMPGYYVIGGAERLFNAFLKETAPKSIVSYCDLSKFSGDVYRKLGFSHSHNTVPTKNWSKGSKRITNNLLLQRGFDQLFNTNYGKGTDNEALMIAHGWLPVYDCGQGVYVWKSE